MIQWLRGRQLESGDTDLIYSRRLGLTRSHWVKLKLGRQKSITHRVILGALAAYPEHRDEIMRMIESNGHKTT